MAAHYMPVRRESDPSPAAIRNREGFANSPVWEKIFPVRYIDQEHSLERADMLLESGGSVVYIITPPSIEDIFRVARLLAKRPAVVTRNVLVPAAIHQIEMIEYIGVPLFGVEAVPIVTEHSLEKKNYSTEEIIGHVRHYITRLTDVLSHNGVVVGAFQADQAPSLEPPKKKVLKLIIDTADRAGVDNVGFTFIGIDILGRNIRESRHISVKRHTYEFRVGRFFTKREFKEEAAREGLTWDQLGYRQLLPLVSPAYRSE